MKMVLPDDEGARQTALLELDILDSGREEAFDRITRIVAQSLNVPICLISLIDDEREWFKSTVGLDAIELPRDGSFCAYAIAGEDIMEVPDATQDARFSDRPSVVGEPGIRSYAGAPLRTRDGYKLGTLSAIDTKVRKFTEAKLKILDEMSYVVMDLIEQRKLRRENQAAEHQLQSLMDSVPALVAKLDRHGRYKFVNKNWEQWTGVAAADVVGRHYEGILAPEVAVQVVPLIEAALGGSETSAVIWVAENSRKIQIFYRPIFDSAHAVDGCVGCAVDVTSLVHAERQLQETEVALRDQAGILQTALDSIEHAVAVWDEDNGLQAWNPAFQALGEFPDELMTKGSDVRPFFFYAAASGLIRSREARLTRIWEVANTPCRGGAGISDLEVSDGRIFSVWSKAKEAGGLVTVFQDITLERRRQDILTQLHEISMASGMSADGKMESMLRLGMEFYGLDLAIVSCIEDDHFMVEHAVGGGNAPAPGAVFRLSETYCAQTIVADGPLVLNNVGHSEHRAHPCYENSGLEAYIGCQIVVDGKPYGTVSFSAPTPRATDFSGNERMIIRLLAQWCGTELLRSKTNKELKTACDQLTDAVESMPEAFILFEENEELVLSNSKYAEFFGIASSRLVPGTTLQSLADELGEVLAETVAEGDEHQAVRSLQRSILGGEGSSGQIARISDGRWLHFSERRTQTGGLVGICTDVTDLIAIQDQLEEARVMAESANEAKSQFLSSMSHELRTPMNSVLGFGQLLNEDPRSPLDENQQRYVSQILRSGGHLLKLIDEVLDLSKIELGNLDVLSEPLSAGEVIDESILIAGTLAAKKGISIETAVDTSQLPTILADRTRVQQVVLNLLSNAVKYNRDSGQIRVDAKVIGNERLRIAISDTGFGIPEEHRDLLFQPFSRLPMNDTEIEGSGIGLALSKKLVERMGGKIGFTSVVGEGTEFWFELPLTDEGPIETETKTKVITRPENGKSASGKILYVEDNPANLELMEEIVRRLPGLHLLSAHTAEFGLTIARQERPELILMDINLPGMDGFAALKALKQDPETSDIPVIALTANAMPADIESGRKAGFVRYLTKPIKVAEISGAIREALR